MTLHSGVRAYTQTQARPLKGTALESAALTKAAMLLDDARHHPGNGAALGKALDYNLKLWTVFQADLCEAGNQLPDDLKSDLLSLSLFMDRSVAQLLGGFDADILDTMIEVSRNLAMADHD